MLATSVTYNAQDLVFFDEMKLLYDETLMFVPDVLFDSSANVAPEPYAYHFGFHPMGFSRFCLSSGIGTSDQLVARKQHYFQTSGPGSRVLSLVATDWSLCAFDKS